MTDALRPLQVEFVERVVREWETDKHYSLILAAPPGTGKTRAALSARLRRPRAGACLVVGVLGQGVFWDEEWQRLQPDVSATPRFQGTKDKPIVWNTAAPLLVFTHIQHLVSEFRKCFRVVDSTSVRDETRQAQEPGVYLTPFQRSHSPFYEQSWDLVIVDESMFLHHPFWLATRHGDKKHTGQRPAKKHGHWSGRACYALSYTACLLLNGTLVSRRVLDIAGQVHMLLRPRLLANGRVPTGAYDGGSGDARFPEWWRAMVRDDERLKRCLQEWIFGRGSRFEGLAHIAMRQVQLHEETVECPMTPLQQSIWEAVRTEARRDPEQVLTRLSELVLSQIAPQLLTDGHDYLSPLVANNTWTLSDAPKLEVLVTRLVPECMADEDEEEGQMLVFSTSQVALDLVDVYLRQTHPMRFRGPTLRVQSGQSRTERQDVLTRFRRGPIARKPWDERVLLLSFYSCVALNLQCASRVVFLDQPKTAHERDQAVHRAWRMGQRRDQVHVTHLVTSGCPQTGDPVEEEVGSTDQRFIQLQRKKRRERTRVGLASASCQEPEDDDMSQFLFETNTPAAAPGRLSNVYNLLASEPPLSTPPFHLPLLSLSPPRMSPVPYWRIQCTAVPLSWLV